MSSAICDKFEAERFPNTIILVIERVDESESTNELFS